MAATIDEVITALDGVIREAHRTRSRMGYFAILYRRVTVEVRDRCNAGYFEDNDRLRQLDVIFANRYLEAWEAYQNGTPLTHAWRVSFKASKKPGLRVIHHLMLGMHAHISLDLGIAVATVANGTLDPGLQQDFNRLNAILSELTDEVEDNIARVSPLIWLLDRLAGRMDEDLAAISMVTARERAWQFAQQLIPLQEPEWLPHIDTRDREIAVQSTVLANLPVPLWLRILFMGEGFSVRRILKKLAPEVLTSDG